MSSENLTINYEQISADNDINEITVFVDGSLDNYNYKEFIEKIDSLIKDNSPNLIFNCSNLDYISASGLGAFVEILRKVKEYGGSLVLVCLQPQVFEVFNILGFSSFINIIGRNSSFSI